jgi:hypothetical protein
MLHRLHVYPRARSQFPCPHLQHLLLLPDFLLQLLLLGEQLVAQLGQLVVLLRGHEPVVTTALVVSCYECYRVNEKQSTYNSK